MDCRKATCARTLTCKVLVGPANHEKLDVFLRSFRDRVQGRPQGIQTLTLRTGHGFGLYVAALLAFASFGCNGLEQKQTKGTELVLGTS